MLLLAASSRASLRRRSPLYRRSTCVAKAQHNFICTSTNTRWSPVIAPLLGGWRSFRTDTRKGKSRPMGPPLDRLPPLLTAAAMAEHCRQPGNKFCPLIALDVAPSNFGIAVSNKTKTQAFAVTAVDRLNVGNNNKSTVHPGFTKLQEVIDKHRACGLVVGWPLTKAGIAEMECVKILRFLSDMMLKGKIALPVTFYDERNTTAIALSKLRKYKRLEGDVELAELVNQTAAMFILRRFLKSTEFAGSMREGRTLQEVQQNKQQRSSNDVLSSIASTRPSNRIDENGCSR